MIFLPTIYLNPSRNELNHYIDGGTEEYYMNLIVDELVPYLTSSTVNYFRYNFKPSKSKIKEKTENNYDLNLEINSGKISNNKTEKARGINIFFVPGNPDSNRASKIFCKNFKEIYPLSDNIQRISLNTLGTLKHRTDPYIKLEIAKCDSEPDSIWVKENIEKISENLAMSITEFFALPLVNPQIAQVITTSSEIDLYTRPNKKSDIVTTIPKDVNLLKLGEWENWFTVDYIGYHGFVENNI